MLPNLTRTSQHSPPLKQGVVLRIAFLPILSDGIGIIQAQNVTAELPTRLRVDKQVDPSVRMSMSPSNLPYEES